MSLALVSSTDPDYFYDDDVYLPPRPPSPAHAPYTEWWTDFYWHRHMFEQSVCRWEPQHAYGLVLQLTRSRTEFTTPKHARILVEAQQEAEDFERVIKRAMAGELRTIASYFPQDLDRVHEQIGFIGYEGEALRATSTGPSLDARTVPALRPILRGWPCQNPITRLWELRQLQTLWATVYDLISDTRLDLALELSERLPAAVVQDIDPFAYPAALRIHARERGEPGDPRRAVVGQVYPPMPPEPTNETQLRAMPPSLIAKARLNYW